MLTEALQGIVEQLHLLHLSRIPLSSFSQIFAPFSSLLRLGLPPPGKLNIFFSEMLFEFFKANKK